MDIKAIRTAAREKMKGYCRVCPVCDGRACAGEVPGMGGTGTGEAFMENVRALARVKLNMRVVHDVLQPDTSTELFGQKLRTPIMAAPIGSSANAGGAISELEMITALVAGSDLAGGMGWIGDPANARMYEDGLAALRTAGRGVAIIKPRIDHQEILALFELAEKAGAVALGLDVDGAGLVTMALKGQPVGPKSEAQLRELAEAVSLPFIVKGIMTPDEAIKCKNAGAAAIVVSNHGGRVLDHTPGTAAVLPKIVAAVQGKVKVLVDGGVRSGADVLKLIALGADGVLVGRPLMVGAFGGGVEGVKALVEKYTAELRSAMILTGCKNLREVTAEILHKE